MAVDEEQDIDPTIEEYKNQVNHLISLNQDFTAFTDTEKAILSTLQTLESEAAAFNEALRHIDSSRQDKRGDKVLPQRQNERNDKQDHVSTSVLMPLLRDYDDSFDFQVQDSMSKEQEEEDALKRLEDALFCDDLDTSSSDESSSTM
jgi:hypothetical protein